MEHLDNDGNRFCIEVMGRSDSSYSFKISKHEIEKPHLKNKFYKVIFATNVMHDSKWKIRNLGNIFLLENSEDFFANSKFNLIYKGLEIRFKFNEF